MLAPRTFAPRVAKPKSDPRFVAVTEQAKAASQKLKQHPPAARKIKEASKSAKPPANERLAGAKAKVVDAVKEAPAPKPQPASFKALLRAEIDKAMPKTLGDTEKFMEGGAQGQMKEAASGGVARQKDAATGPADQAVKQAPNPGAVPEQPSTPLPAEAPAAAPPIAGDKAMPLPATAQEASLQETKKDTDQALKDEKVKPESLARANDPRFSAVAEAKGKVASQADRAPAQFRAKEGAVLAGAGAKAASSARNGALLMAGRRGAGQAKVLSRQQQQAAKEEAERAKVAANIEGIYARTKARVEARLGGLDAEVGALFDPGVEAAIAQMKRFVDDKLFDYKLRRYLSIPLVGLARWLRDAALGLPDEVNVFYAQGRALFTKAMDALIDRVAALVERRLAEAKADVAAGQAEIRAYVASLPAQLQAAGKAAESAVTDRFKELEAGIESKKNEIAQGLAQKYKEAFDKADEALKQMQEENKGLVAGFLEKLGEIVKALMEFKSKLLGLLKKGMETIQLILDDPIGFLGNLLAAVKGGFNAFIGNIWTHLKAGFFKWLLGSLAAAGITLPSDLSLMSVFKLVLDVLGITYPKLRAKAVKLIGETAVTVIEKLAEYVQALFQGGVAALWEKVKDDLSSLKDMVIGAIQDWLIETVVKQAVTKIVSMFNPAGAIVQAIIAIYNVVMFVIEKAQQIMALVEAVINSVHAIATGAIGGAIAWIEKSLAAAVPVVIGFLARLLGLSGISDKIRGFIQKVQAKVDAAIDKVIGKIVGVVKKLFGKLKAGAAKVVQWWRHRKAINVEGKRLTLYTEGSEASTRVLVASSPGVPWSTYLARNKPAKAAAPALKAAHATASGLAAKIEAGKPHGGDAAVHAQNVEQWFNELAAQIEILNKDEDKPASVITYGGTDGQGGGIHAEAVVLSHKHPPGNPPGDNAPIWDRLADLGAGKGKSVRGSHYVQGHLLNHNLGGPGLRFNLTPITKRANNKHKADVESTIKDEVNKAKGKVIYYKVTALGQPPRGANPRLAELKAKQASQKAKGRDLTKNEQAEMLSLKALGMLTSGFKCQAWELEKDSSGEWTKKGKILGKLTTTIENNIEDGGRTYGY
ncbi:hypothetical protein LXT12_05610 [Pelomonas sp. P7]|uniref:Phage-related protein n=1 Tax=Pelomonas caseinilytica TaxID=2906763 RepID=A0ABS8X7X0_9BURK|nr:hypothetical protein [Pelomonas sp. P7]MCE4536726.1 hypothetical protein [Pelomonas sp. P7]